MFFLYTRHLLRLFFLGAIIILCLGTFIVPIMTTAATPHSSPRDPVLLIGGERIERVSVATSGNQSYRNSFRSTISGNGRYVAFISYADNLVGGDLNDKSDVFLRDRQTNVTSRESIATGGAESNENSDVVVLSEDGRYVVFVTGASSLVPNDTNNQRDVFLRDRMAGITERVSLTNAGNQANEFSGTEVDVSADGNLIIFPSLASNLVLSDTNSHIDIFLRNRSAATTIRISSTPNGLSPNDDSFVPRISPDGRYITYESQASNLVAADTNSVSDVFIYDSNTATTSLVSLTSAEAQSNGTSTLPSISRDGRYVAFQSSATNLVAGDTNNKVDIFVRDRWNGETERISLSSGGQQGNGDSVNADVSVDGRYVVFRSYATNLVNGDNNNYCDIDYNGSFTENCDDIFVHDRLTHLTTRVSVSSFGAEGNSFSGPYAAVSDTADEIALDSAASNFVTGDTNGLIDVFVTTWQEPIPGTTATTTPTFPATFTPMPTPTGTTAPPQGALFLPVVMHQLAFATPLPATLTPTPTSTPTALPCLTSEVEPNDTLAFADQNPWLCADQSIPGRFVEESPPPALDDYYRFQVSSAGRVVMTLESIAVGCDYDVYLYDVQGVLLDGSDEGGSTSEEIAYALPPGTYYLRVYRRSGYSADPYLIRWTTEGAGAGFRLPSP